MKPLWTGIVWLSAAIITALVALAGFVTQQWIEGKPMPNLPQLVAFLNNHRLAIGGVAVLWGAVIWFAQWLKDRKTPTPSTPQQPEPAPNLDTRQVFVGRDAERAALREQIISGGAIITGITGEGGIGKTALALALAADLKERFTGGQHYIDLLGTAPAPLSPEKALEALILSIDANQRNLPTDRNALVALYRSLLAGKSVLVLLDNARDADQVRPLLPPPNSAPIITSRWTFDLDGMRATRLDLLPMEKACELLLSIAPRIGELAQPIAEQCGRLPLALRLAASALKILPMLTPADYLQRLARNRATELNEAFATLRLSYDLLPSPEVRTAWRLLGVFPPGSFFHWAAAKAVWNLEEQTARRTLETLFAAGMVEWNNEVQRYHLHDLARDLAESLLVPDESTAARLRHARHYCDVGSLADELYLEGGQNVLNGLQLFDSERVNIEAAFDWLQTRRDNESAGLVISLVDAIVYTGQALRFRPRQRIRWLESQLEAARIAKQREAECAALGNLGNAYFSSGEARKAIEFYEQQLKNVREIGGRRGEGTALGSLGIAYAALGETRKAIEFYEQHLAIAREIGHRRSEANALGNLGIAYAQLDEARKAIEFYEQQLKIVREIGDRCGEGNALGSLGIAYARLGDARKAIEFYEQQLKIVREIGDRRGEGAALGNFGIAYAALGEARKAIEFYEQQLKIVREFGDRRGEGTALGNFGTACMKLGEARKAIEFYEQALVIDREIGDRCGEGSDLWNSALAYAALGQKAEAIERAEAALAILDAIEDPHAAKVRARLAKWRGATP